MWASRRASNGGVVVPSRTAAIASPTASKTGSPSPRCSTRSSHQRSGSGSPAAAARSPSGSTGGPPVRRIAGAPSSPSASDDGQREVDRLDDGPVLERPAHRLPLRAELGERGEHGPLGLGDDVAEQGDRRHQAGVADPAQGGVGVGRRLDEHDVGRQGVERPHAPSAPSPGRGGGSPSRCNPGTGRDGVGGGRSAELAAGVVEVAPAVALADHPLEVLAPRDVVVQGVAHDGADDAAGDVGGPQRAVAEVGGEGQAVGDDRDRLGRRQRADRLLQAGAAVGR